MLKWYVLHQNFNKEEIEFYNVLQGWEERIRKARKKVKTKTEFKEWLKKEFMYYYWSRSEYEIVVGGLFSEYPKEFKKVDIWSQIEPNLDRITEYVIKEMGFRFK